MIPNQNKKTKWLLPCALLAASTAGLLPQSAHSDPSATTVVVIVGAGLGAAGAAASLAAIAAALGIAIGVPLISAVGPDLSHNSNANFSGTRGGSSAEPTSGGQSSKKSRHQEILLHAAPDAQGVLEGEMPTDLFRSAKEALQEMICETNPQIHEEDIAAISDEKAAKAIQILANSLE